MFASLRLYDCATKVEGAVSQDRHGHRHARRAVTGRAEESKRQGAGAMLFTVSAGSERFKNLWLLTVLLFASSPAPRTHVFGVSRLLFVFLAVMGPSYSPYP